MLHAQPASLPHPGFKFDPSVAPSTSRWAPPAWMLQHSNPPTPKQVNRNGLGHDFDPKNPMYLNTDLRKPDPRIKVPDITISGNEDSEMTAFVGFNILDSTGAMPYSGDVFIRGQRIVSVGPKISEEDLRKCRVVQGRGRTLMSGLVDAHTHFTWTNAGSLDGLASMAVEEHTLFSARSARTFLDCGYTMCLGAASAKDRIDVVINNAIKAGDIPGPRFLPNAREMAPLSGALIPGITRFVEDETEIEAAVAEYAEMGATQIKLSMSGEEITETLRAEDTTFPDELVAAGCEAAHNHGMRICSHARSDESIIQCLQYGVDVIYHASFISDGTMKLLENQQDRVYVVPAINWLVGTLYDAEAFGYPIAKAESVGYGRELEVAVAGLKEMYKRGIKILPGGDYGFAWTPHGTYRDLEHFVKLIGMSPMDAILSATALGGDIMLHPNELGKVQPGFYADLIVVDGNPLDDISLLSGHEHIDMVMINGRVHKEAYKDAPTYYEPTRSLFDEANRLKEREKAAEGK